MSEAFAELYDEVMRATNFISSYEQCCPHYQRVLDYIVAHPEQREHTSKLLMPLVADGGYNQLSLLQFLMETLKWPEIREAAKARCEIEGNLYYEVKHLVDVYGSAAS